MNDNTYNGWSNWATWNLVLWTDNDEGAYRRARRFVSWAGELAGFNQKCRIFMRELWPEGTPDMTHDDMRDVNWDEVEEYMLQLAEA